MFKRIYEEVAEETSEKIRSNEVRALNHSIQLMDKAQKGGPGSRDSIEAMFFVSRLWSVLLEDLASSDNALPDELRAKIISIGIWALKYVEEFRRGLKKDFQPLIDVSAIILKGLSVAA
jgi:flagellar biosynthesis activator protein FlaF